MDEDQVYVKIDANTPYNLLKWHNEVLKYIFLKPCGKKVDPNPEIKYPKDKMSSILLKIEGSTFNLREIRNPKAPKK